MSLFARFAQNRGALVGLVILLLMIAMAVLAPVLFPIWLSEARVI